MRRGHWGLLVFGGLLSASCAANPESTRLNTATSRSAGYRAANERTSARARTPVAGGFSTTM